MYRYFISFTHNTPEESGYGNVIVETNLEFSGGRKKWLMVIRIYQNHKKMQYEL